MNHSQLKQLSPLAPLNDIDQQGEGVSLELVSGKSLVSVAIPLDGEANLSTALLKVYQFKVPSVGKSGQNKTGDICGFGMQIDRVLLYFDASQTPALEQVANDLGDAGYYTDLSDSQVILKLSGNLVRAALERICLLDLHADIFQIGDVARTQMEHMNVIIYRSGYDEFTLFSARSCAESFLHVIETSLFNVSVQPETPDRFDRSDFE